MHKRSSADPPVSRPQRAVFVAAVALTAFPNFTAPLGAITLLPEHLGVVLLLLLVFQRGRRRATGVRTAHPAAVFALCLFVLWWLFTLMPSLFVAPDTMQSLRLMAWVAASMLMCTLVYVLREVALASLQPLAWALSVVLFIVLIGWATAQLTGSANLLVEIDYATSAYRVQGFFSEPNLYAAFITLAAATLYARRRDLSPVSYWVFLTLGAISVYLTFTRAAWVTLGLVIVAGIVSGFRHRPVALTLGLTMSVAGFAVVTLTTSGGLWQTGDPVFDATVARISGLFTTSYGTGFTRVLTIESALDDLSRHGMWWTGFGFNGYTQMHDTGVTDYAAAYLPTLWIAIIYDGGLIAAAFFIIAVLSAWWATRRGGTTLFFLSFAVLAASTNNTWFAFPWVFGALITGTTFLTRDHPREAGAASAPRDAASSGALSDVASDPTEKHPVLSADQQP